MAIFKFYMQEKEPVITSLGCNFCFIAWESEYFKTSRIFLNDGSIDILHLQGSTAYLLSADAARPAAVS